jgi:hypothetical protein
VNDSVRVIHALSEGKFSIIYREVAATKAINIKAARSFNTMCPLIIGNGSKFLKKSSSILRDYPGHLYLLLTASNQISRLLLIDFTMNVR